MQGPILRPIQRLGKLGKRSNVPRTETADPNQTKDPKFVYLSIDECGSHVGERKNTFFRCLLTPSPTMSQQDALRVRVRVPAAGQTLLETGAHKARIHGQIGHLSPRACCCWSLTVSCFGAWAWLCDTLPRSLMCVAWMPSRGSWHAMTHRSPLACGRLVVGAYEVREDREALLGTTCSEPFMVVRNNDNTEGASYSPIQIPVKQSWAGWSAASLQVRCIAFPQSNHVNGTALRSKPAHPLSAHSTVLSEVSKIQLQGLVCLA